MLSIWTSSSFFPYITIPEIGQGDKKVKSYKLGWGEIVINLFTSGLRIINCIQINEPKEKPDTQHWLYPGFSFSIQSSAAAASESSPWPLSNIPSLLPTPLKFILITEKLFL